MADGKWITDLTESMPLIDAARRVLTVRLQVVDDQLPLALQSWQEDPEYIHQLRVGTRRARAALAIFESCFPGEVRKTLRRQLRNLRRAAGAARDWDVFGETLSERAQCATLAQRPGLDFLIGYCQGQRVTAQEALAAASPGERFKFKDALAGLRSPSVNGGEQQLKDITRPWLTMVLHQLEIAAAGNLEEYDHLHRVRILGKRLRYGMEVFAACFEPPFKDDYYPMIEEMQEILGFANDSQGAVQRLTFLRGLLKTSRPAEWKQFKAGIESLLRYHQRRLSQERRRFVSWRQRWEESGARAALTGMVSVSP